MVDEVKSQRWVVTFKRYGDDGGGAEGIGCEVEIVCDGDYA